MAKKQLPYVVSSGNITKALEGMKRASTPPRFTQDFLGTKLNLTGGSARPVIPFLKRTGFLAADGTPTDRYHRFRNDATSGAAAAEALREGFRPMFEINEYVHEASDKELKGVAKQASGLEDGSRALNAIVASFKALHAFADFEADSDEATQVTEDVVGSRDIEESAFGAASTAPLGGLSLGYTINLHLPPTSDIAVFDAIFKSLRQHLLR